MNNHFLNSGNKKILLSTVISIAISITVPVYGETMLDEAILKQKGKQVKWTVKKATEKLKLLPTSPLGFNTGGDPMKMMSKSLLGVQYIQQSTGDGGDDGLRNSISIMGFGTQSSHQHKSSPQVTFGVDGLIGVMDNDINKNDAVFYGDPDMMKAVEVSVGGDLGVIGSGGSGHINFMTKDPEDLLLKGQSRGYLVKFGLDSNGSEMSTVAAYQKKSRIGLLVQYTYRDAKNYYVPSKDHKIPNNKPYGEHSLAEHDNASLIGSTRDATVNKYFQRLKTGFKHKQYLLKGTIDLKNGDRFTPAFTRFTFNNDKTEGDNNIDRSIDDDYGSNNEWVNSYKEYKQNNTSKGDNIYATYKVAKVGILENTEFLIGLSNNESRTNLTTDQHRKPQYRLIDGGTLTDEDKADESIYEIMDSLVSKEGDVLSHNIENTKNFKINTEVKGVNLGFGYIDYKFDKKSDRDVSVSQGNGSNKKYIVKHASYYHSQKTLGMSASKQFNYGKTTITPSVRLENAIYESSGINEASNANAGLRTKYKNVTKKAMSAGISLSNELNDKVSLFASAKHMQNMPKASLIYSADYDTDDSCYQKASYDVKPNKNNILKAGVGYQSSQSIFNTKGTLSFKVEAWQNRLKDDFQEQSCEKSLDDAKQKYSNGSGRTINGLDVYGEYYWLNNTIDARVSYSQGRWDASHTSKEGRHVFTGEPYEGSTPLTLYANYTKAFIDGDKFEYNIHALSKFTQTPKDKVQLRRKAVVLHNAYYTWNLDRSKNTYMRGSIENIFNTHHLGGGTLSGRLYTQPGRKLSIEIIKKF